MSSEYLDQDWNRASLVLQARQSGIMDKAILKALEAVPRENFVPEEFLDHTYRDVSIPLQYGQSMISPIRIAKFLNIVQIEAPANKILEIGTGSGYGSALLAQMSKRLFTVEQHKSLTSGARAAWHDLGITNIIEQVGDGSAGWQFQAPFDHIFVWGAVEELPKQIASQLTNGGSVFFAKGSGNEEQDIVLATMIDGVLDEQFHGKTRLPALRIGKV